MGRPNRLADLEVQEVTGVRDPGHKSKTSILSGGLWPSLDGCCIVGRQASKGVLSALGTKAQGCWWALRAFQTALTHSW